MSVTASSPRVLPGLSVLFLWDGYVLTQNGVGGASALAYSHLETLVQAGCNVHLVSLSREGEVNKCEIISGALADQVAGFRPLDVQRPKNLRASRMRRWLLALRDPVGYEAHWCSQASREALRAVVLEVQPELIWAEHLRPAALAATTDLDVPIVYSHHDWKWKIKRLRSLVRSYQLVKRLHYVAIRRAEEALVRRVDGVVTGSATEADDVRELTNAQVAYFPTTYEPVTISDQKVHQPPRIVHLGGMGTTASRQGLERFLDLVWPQVTRQIQPKPELWIIGKIDQASAKLRHKFSEVGAICTGFVPDLSTVLRPFDVHVIPWEYDTGTRTRLPVAMNHMQVVVATNAAVAGLSEARDGENCRLVDRLEAMGDVLVAVHHYPAQREHLGRRARKTFEESLTRSAQQPRFNRYLSSFLVR